MADGKEKQKPSMKQSVRIPAIGSLYYLVTSIAGGVISYLTTFYLARRLPLVSFGYVSEFDLALTLGLPLVQFPSALLLVNRIKKSSEVFTLEVCASILISSMVVILIAIATLTFKIEIGPRALAESGNIPLVVLTLASQVIPAIKGQLLMADKRFRQYALLTIGSSSTTLVLILVASRLAADNYKVKIESQLLVNSIISLALLATSMKAGMRTWIQSLTSLKSLVVETSVLLPHTMSSTLYFAMDRLLVSRILGAEQLGIYALAQQISQAASLFQASFANVWIPARLHELHIKDSNKVFTAGAFYSGPFNDPKERRAAWGILIAAGIILIAVAVLYTTIIPPRFSAGIWSAQLLVISQAALALYKVIIPRVWNANLSKFLGFGALAALATTSLAGYSLQSQYGMTGVAAGVVAGTCVQAIYTIYIVKREKS